MYAYKHRPAEDFVEPRRSHVRGVASGDQLSQGVPSPARALQAQLGEALAGSTAPAAAEPGLSIRARFAIIAGLAMLSWVPIAAAGVIVLA